MGTMPFVFSDLHVSRTYPYRAERSVRKCIGPLHLRSRSCSTLVRLDQSLSVVDAAVFAPDQRWCGSNGRSDDGSMSSYRTTGWAKCSSSSLRTQASQADILRLFNGVTAIVIGAQVRPSFYYALTGAIYLDADNFWLTAAQRDVINEAPDFRSEFDRDLMYSGVWRYTPTIRIFSCRFRPFRGCRAILAICCRRRDG